MTTTKEFIDYLKWSSFVEYNNLNAIVDPSKDKSNIYFCCWLWEKLSRRCNDDDINTKKYFLVDVDIRLEYFQKTWEVISQVDLVKEIWNIVKILNDSWIDDYTALVDSGNGLHIYFCWNERTFDKKIYANGVSYIYNQIDTIIASTWYKCDKSTCNIARISRLPWTINPRIKQKKNAITKEIEILWDLWSVECEILKFQPQVSELFERIEKYAEEYEKEIQIDREAQKQIKNIIKSDYKKSDDIRSQINNIPAHEIATDIWGVTLLDRWLDNVALSEWHKNMWAYWYKPHNVIVNTWSSLIKTDKSYFTPYELIYYELMDQDKKRTVDYFKDKYNIITEDKPKWIQIPKIKYEKEWYIYPNNTFDAFDCVMSWELVTIVAESNSWKTTFAMDIIQVNAQRGKKCFYINLEFPIETMRQSRRLYINGKKKRNMTDIDPLSSGEKIKMDSYVESKLKQFDYHNDPNWMQLEDIISMILKKKKEWYWLFVIDTFSRITGNLDTKIAHTSQNKTMELLQELCQNTGVCIVLLHHTNKKWEFEWSQKIMDLSNVFIMMTKDEDMSWKKITKFALTKDKFVSRIELETYYINQEYTLITPEDPF